MIPLGMGDRAASTGATSPSGARGALSQPRATRATAETATPVLGNMEPPCAVRGWWILGADRRHGQHPGRVTFRLVTPRHPPVPRTVGYPSYPSSVARSGRPPVPG